MLQSANINIKYVDVYGLKLLMALSILLLLLAYTSFYLIQNYYSKSFLEYNLNGKKIYFLESNTLHNMHKKNGMDYDNYLKRVEYFKELALENGYDSKNIYADELDSLDKKAKLIALDMMSLSTAEVDDIDTFVKNGGRILFNFTSGFLDPSLQYKSDNLVKRVTGLMLDEKFNTINYEQNSTGYMSTKLLSPLTKYLTEGETLELAIYDPLPLFSSKDKERVDAYLTNWSQSNYIEVSGSIELTQSQSALIWHGYKDSGKWIYFNFPSYVFLETAKVKYANLFKGMVEYLDEDIIPMAYPYIDAKNIVFVSEDTEYKYENLEQFYNISLKNKFPVTAFCVAELAEKNSELMKKVSKSKYLEIGSHSYTHKKIVGEDSETYERETEGSKTLLNTLSSQNITGFRPPREEIDEEMIDLLNDADFKYVLSAGLSRLYPYFNDGILMIPRHGTDDYSYLINLDWDSSQILQEMKHQVNLLVDLNGIYTLSIHTHLMAFSTNINIVDDFFKYVNSQKEMTPMNGKMIYERIFQFIYKNYDSKKSCDDCS